MGKAIRIKVLGLICILSILSTIIWAKEDLQERSPPTSPYIKNGVNLYTTLEFIYWKAVQEGLCYADTGIAIVPGTTMHSPGRVHHPHFPWGPGFKIGLGYFLPHDGWDLYVNYTWLYSNGFDRAKNANGNIVAIGLSFPETLTTQINHITSASNRWILHFNAIDLELGKDVYLSRFLTFRLFTGLKFNWQSQDLHNKYIANQVTIENVTQAGITHSHQDQNVWGIGIRLGINSNWYFYRSWSLAAKMAFSGMWLDYNNSRYDRFHHGNHPPIVINHLKKDLDTIKTVIELFLGLQHEWLFKNERYHLKLQSGFDEQLWINFEEFIYLFSQGKGDFSLFGFHIKASLNF